MSASAAEPSQEWLDAQNDPGHRLYGLSWDEANQKDAADEGGGGESLSQHPEAKRARERRRKARSGSRKTSSSSSSGSRKGSAGLGAGEIRVRLGEAFSELAAALERRDPELSDVLERDGPKMAELLGRWGDHPKAPPFVKVAVVVLAEILEPLRAFGGTFRLLLRRMRERQLARQDEQPWAPPEEGLVAEPVPEPEPVIDNTPDRFRV